MASAPKYKVFNPDGDGNSSMRYYMGTIIEHHGEFEFTETFLFKTTGCPDTAHKRHASEWYGRTTSDHTDKEKAEGVYWLDTLLYQAGDFYDLDEAVYRRLKFCHMPERSDDGLDEVSEGL